MTYSKSIGIASALLMLASLTSLAQSPDHADEDGCWQTPPNCVSIDVEISTPSRDDLRRFPQLRTQAITRGTNNCGGTIYATSCLELSNDDGSSGFRCAAAGPPSRMDPGETDTFGTAQPEHATGRAFWRWIGSNRYDSNGLATNHTACWSKIAGFHDPVFTSHDITAVASILETSNDTRNEPNDRPSDEPNDRPSGETNDRPSTDATATAEDDEARIIIERGRSPWLDASDNGQTADADDGGSNSCEFANDGECDDGASCAIGTDTADCRNAGQNSCRYANDGACDEGLYCGIGTDTADCRNAGQNSCEFANDGTCDEGLYCAIGTDTADCRNAGQNSCDYANDGECDEGTYCAIGTDTTDCRNS